jgi:GTPase SAR1 family protein
MADAEHDLLYKLIIVGDRAVGKSSLLSRFVENEFSREHVTTIGVDFKYDLSKFGAILTFGYSSLKISE